jgi:hypothetical protein
MHQKAMQPSVRQPTQVKLVWLRRKASKNKQAAGKADPAPNWGYALPKPLNSY